MAYRVSIRIAEQPSPPVEERFDRWCEVVASLPRRQTRMLTWPLLAVFGVDMIDLQGFIWVQASDEYD